MDLEAVAAKLEELEGARVAHSMAIRMLVVEQHPDEGERRRALENRVEAIEGLYTIGAGKDGATHRVLQHALVELANLYSPSA